LAGSAAHLPATAGFAIISPTKLFKQGIAGSVARQLVTLVSKNF
jgi:hypothetical protein